MSHHVLHESLNLVSFFTSVLGLYILYNTQTNPSVTPPADDDTDNTSDVLFAMTFAYWIVHCLAVGAQQWISPDWETFTMSLKWLAMISFLLTFSCALSLPLHQFSAGHQGRTDP